MRFTRSSTRCDVMKVSDFTKKALAFRRQERELRAKGYLRHDIGWRILSDGKPKERIIDAVVSTDGLHIYTLVGQKEPR